MRLDVLIALSIASTLALGGTTLAQQPAPSPAPAAPSGPPADYAPPITNEQAKTVAAAALAEAKKNNWRMAFAIVGPAGELVYFEKMDGTQLTPVGIFQVNARASTAGRASAIETRLQAVSSWKVLLFPAAVVTGSRPIKYPRAATQLSPFTYNEGTIDTSKRFPVT